MRINNGTLVDGCHIRLPAPALPDERLALLAYQFAQVGGAPNPSKLPAKLGGVKAGRRGHLPRQCP
eukprot:327683-Pleurochrysis_carterae.AAC.1